MMIKPSRKDEDSQNPFNCKYYLTASDKIYEFQSIKT